MFTLYYSPGACSLASHIMLRENNIQFNLKKVNLKTHKTEDDRDFFALSQNKGYVPVLVFENGDTLTEGCAILFFITEQNPSNNYATGKSDLRRYRLQEALTFVSSELHKTLGSYFSVGLPDAYKDILRAKLSKTFNWLDKKLCEQPYLSGQDFTAADAYAFTVLRWLPHLNTGLSLTDWPNVQLYIDKILQRPSVIEAMQVEGVS